MQHIRIIRLLFAVVVIATLGGCFDREPMFRPTQATAPTPPESTWVERCDTSWTQWPTKAVTVSTNNRTATRITGLSVPCVVNRLRYGAIVVYSDSYDQSLMYFLEKQSDSNVRLYFADSLGRTTIPQPTNYRGRRYMTLTLNDVPVGQYNLKMYYAGTISSPSRARPSSVYGTTWNVDAPVDTLHLGCIDCRLIKVPR